MISNDYEESKLNVSATDNKCIDISAIKNIVLSNFKKYEDELIALNELEKLIVHITEKTNNENIKEFEMSYKNLFINHSFTEGEFNHSKDKLLADISLSSDNKFIKKKYRSSCYNLLHKK